MSTPTLDVGRRRRLDARSLRLAYATAGYNLAEGLVAVAAGTAASSTALIGFGLDSFVEVSSALVVIWQFRTRVPEDRERFALRLIALSFFALAAWITFGTARSLLGQSEAEPSTVGIVLAAVSVVVMPLLVWAKRRTGRELGSVTVLADSTQTLLCTYLSAILLAGLALNATLGWSWADPSAALIIAVVALREGIRAWRGERCADCATPTSHDNDRTDDCRPSEAPMQPDSSNVTGVPAPAAASVDPEPRYVGPTPLLDYGHPAIQGLVRAHGWATGDADARIGAIYTYVRDEIRFGYNPSDDLPASAVLADGYGQCNTKTTLLMALLRASGIPTRFHGATIRKQLQRGVVTGLFYRLAPASIVHSWAEVLVDGQWVALEGVILDRPYLDGLRNRFPEQPDEFLGYGVGTDNLANPPIDWCGTSTAIQATGIDGDHGTFDDPDTYYRQHGANLAGLKALLYRGWVRHVMNRNVAAIRTRRAPAGTPDRRSGRS